MSSFAIEGPKAINWRVDEDESPPLAKQKLMEKILKSGDVQPDKEHPDKPVEPAINFDDLIGINNLKDINYLHKAVGASKSVARVHRSDGGLATGFLISADILMTNQHVFANKGQATGAKVEFNYQLGLDGDPLKSYNYTCDPDDLFVANEALDYAIVRIKRKPGHRWGFLTLKPDVVTIKVNDKVNIIQHPGGEPKKIAMNDNEVKYVDPSGQYIQYVTDASEGSSGAPVLNDDWQVVALHFDQGVSPNGLYMRNEGKRIDAIIADLPDAIRNEILG